MSFQMILVSFLMQTYHITNLFSHFFIRPIFGPSASFFSSFFHIKIACLARDICELYSSLKCTDCRLDWHCKKVNIVFNKAEDNFRSFLNCGNLSTFYAFLCQKSCNLLYVARSYY